MFLIRYLPFVFVFVALLDFFLYLEFRNRFIFIAMIRCFSCLFVYLFCVSFPFRWLSFSKLDNLFEFLFGAVLSEVLFDFYNPDSLF